MAENTSVGNATISLDIEASGDLKAQVEKMTGVIEKQIEASLKNIGNLDFKGLADTLSNTISKAIDNSMKNIQQSINKSINSALSNIKGIKIPVDFGVPTNSPAYKESAVSSISTPRAPPIPKIKAGINLDVVKAQIDNLSSSIDITNAKIEQQQEKLAGLKESYALAFDGTRKNKLEEEILKTEATINKLTATSDKAGFKLADLDAQFAAINASAKGATSGINAFLSKLKQMLGISESSSSSMKSLSKATKDTGNSFRNSHNSMSMFFGTMIRWGIIFPMIIKGITAIGTSLLNSLKVNDQFSSSLNLIRSNLYTAFMPIYQAILPAVNTLMSALATATAYIASFISNIFGKTYQQSFNAAKAMQTQVGALTMTEKQAKKTATSLTGVGNAATAAGNATKKAAGGLAGFDQINKLSGSSAKGAGAPGSGVITPITPMANMAPIEAATSKWAEGFKKILSTIFQPFKNAWVAVGSSVTTEFNKAIEGTKTTLDNFFKKLATPPVQQFLENIGRLVLSITKLGLKIYDGFILPIVNWFIDKLPGAADGLNPILKAVTKLINYLSGDGFKYVKDFLGLFLTWKAGAFIVEMARATAAIVSHTIATTADKTETIILMGMYAKDTVVSLAKSVIAWGAQTGATIANTIALGVNKIALIASTVAVGAWNIICGIATIATTAFGIAVAFLTSPIGIIILAIAALIAIGVLLYKNWDAVSAFLTNCWNGIKTTASIVWNSIVTTIKNVFNGIGTWFSNVFTAAWNSIKSAFSAVGSFFGGVWDTIKSKFTSIGSTIGNAIGGAFKTVVNSIIGFAENSINGFIRAINGALGLINKIPGVNIKPLNTLSIPKLARGGVIDQPTLAMVGERGKEAVMPLENNTGWIDTLAGKLNSKGQSSDEVLKVLQMIYELLKDLGLDINLDGDKFARATIKQLNKRTRMTGKTELII